MAASELKHEDEEPTSTNGVLSDEESDNNIKKRIIFIRHGNSIWNKAKAGGIKSKAAAIGQGVLEFAKTSYYDTSSHKTSTVMDAPLSDIGIKQCKSLYTFLQEKHTSLQAQLLSSKTYIDSHHKCDQYLHESAKILDNMLLPINQNTAHGNGHADLIKIQELLSKAKDEMNTSIHECQLKVNAEIERLENLISIVSVLITSSDDSIVVCSNLRRAISTAIMGLWHRFTANKEENLWMVSCLQELGYGVDSISHNDTEKVAKESQINAFVKGLGNLVSGPETEADKIRNRKDDKISLSQFEEQCTELDLLNNLNSDINSQKMRIFYEDRLKTVRINTRLATMSAEDLKKKNKQENRKESDKKIELFMDWVFNEKQNKEINTFIVVGHSAWIKAFFNKYSATHFHEYQKSKLRNCAVVSLDIYRNYHFSNNIVNPYTILHDSIVTIYDGSL
eukprot:32152_1